MKRSSMSTGTLLGTRALNRAMLARQLLLERVTMPALEAIERLAGFQAQAPWAPYYNLWTRLSGFHQDELVRLLTGREVVRIALMRSTVHMVSAADCLWMRPLFEPLNERWLRTNYKVPLDGVDLARLASAGRELIEERPLTMAELGAALVAHPSGEWKDRDSDALAQGIRGTVPLVQVPPRGVWGVGGVTRVTSAEHWLARSLDGEPSLARLVLRYLAAYGPATVMDIQTWCGLTRLKPLVDALRPELLVFRNESGKELFDLPDAPRPPSDAPAPVRYLGEFDNMLLSYADRSRIMSESSRRRIFAAKNGVMPRPFLVDGFLHGIWRIDESKGSAVLKVEPYAPLTRADRNALEEEGVRLLTFAAASAETYDIHIGTVE